MPVCYTTWTVPFQYQTGVVKLRARLSAWHRETIGYKLSAVHVGGILES